MTDNIKLPPLPDHWEHGLIEYVRSWGTAAIEADRQARGDLISKYQEKVRALEAENHNLVAEIDDRKRRDNDQQPFGYFRASPFGWTDCAETDEGAIALYERPQAQPTSGDCELPNGLVPNTPNLEYLRSITDNNNLPAYMRAQILAAVRQIEAMAQSSALAQKRENKS